LADCHHALEEAWWIYLVRSLGFQPEPSSHDWHVQPSCQRTDPLPPERALSVQSRLAFSRASRDHTKPACPRNLYKLRVLCDHCQPDAGTGYPPVFHSRGAKSLSNQYIKRSSAHATKRIFRLLTTPMPFRHKPRRKSISLKKRSLGGFCEQRIKPFEEPCPRMKPRGRD
jgi:hypothetical protein